MTSRLPTRNSSSSSRIPGRGWIFVPTPCVPMQTSTSSTTTMPTTTISACDNSESSKLRPVSKVMPQPNTGIRPPRPSSAIRSSTPTMTNVSSTRGTLKSRSSSTTRSKSIGGGAKPPPLTPVVGHRPIKDFGVKNIEPQNRVSTASSNLPSSTSSISSTVSREEKSSILSPTTNCHLSRKSSLPISSVPPPVTPRRPVLAFKPTVPPRHQSSKQSSLPKDANGNTIQSDENEIKVPPSPINRVQQSSPLPQAQTTFSRPPEEFLVSIRTDYGNGKGQDNSASATTTSSNDSSPMSSLEDDEYRDDGKVDLRPGRIIRVSSPFNRRVFHEDGVSPQQPNQHHQQPYPCRYPSLRSLLTPPPSSPGMTMNNYRNSNLVSQNSQNNFPFVNCSSENESITTSNAQSLPITPVRRLSNNDELRGSSSSLLSKFSTDDKTSLEMRRLRCELSLANDKTVTLSTQLLSSQQMVAAFEQNLANMTSRIQQLSLTIEQKDREIQRLKETLETIQKEEQHKTEEKIKSSPMSIEELSANNDKRIRMRSLSRDRGDGQSWIRSSISRAFRKSRSRTKSGCEESDIEQQQQNGSRTNLSLMETSSLTESAAIDFEVSELQSQLQEKDRALTDSRLETLSAVHQMESLKETMNRMREEIERLNQENERLHYMMRPLMVSPSMGSLSSSKSNSQGSQQICDKPEDDEDTLINALKKLQNTVTE